MQREICCGQSIAYDHNFILLMLNESVAQYSPESEFASDVV